VFPIVPGYVWPKLSVKFLNNVGVTGSAREEYSTKLFRLRQSTAIFVNIFHEKKGRAF